MRYRQEDINFTVIHEDFFLIKVVGVRGLDLQRAAKSWDQVSLWSPCFSKVSISPGPTAKNGD